MWFRYPHLNKHHLKRVARFSNYPIQVKVASEGTTLADVQIDGLTIMILCLSMRHTLVPQEKIPQGPQTLQQHITALPLTLQRLCSNIVIQPDGDWS